MEQKELLKKIRLYLFDMDGTLYLGNRLYDFTIELLESLKASGRKYLFMTNNSSKSVEDYIKKLHSLGIESTREDFITSSQATAYYLKEHHPGKKLYVCGTRSLKRELETEGFAVTENLDEVECIVMGFDTELTFKKLEDVSRLLLTREGIPYIATNPDYVCPTEFGSVPDCGSVVCLVIQCHTQAPRGHRKTQPSDAAAGHGAQRLQRRRDCCGGGPDLHGCEVRNQCGYHRYSGNERRDDMEDSGRIRCETPSGSSGCVGNTRCDQMICEI